MPVDFRENSTLVAAVGEGVVAQSVETSDESVERRASDRFFAVGGVIPASQTGYVTRSADSELFQYAMNGEYAHVFAPRQMGKSSLCARVAEQLRDRDRLVAVVDLAQIGGRDPGVDSARWFYSYAFRLVRQLRLKVDLQRWWQDKANLTNRQRLTELYWDVILENTSAPVTIFVDSPHAFATLPFAGDLLESIHAAQTARAAEPAFGRLNFVLLGVAGAARHGTGSGRSVFAASQAVALEPFSQADLRQILPALGLPRPLAERAVARIHHWTNGQPYLTMKLARAVSRRSHEKRRPEVIVDDCLRQLFGHRGALRAEPHLSAIQQSLLGAGRDTATLLNLYGRIRKGERIQYLAESPAQRRLINEGLLTPDANGYLGVSNRLYALLFTTRWVNEHLPIDWRNTAGVLAALVLVFVVPIWYVQYLPGGWIATLRSPETIDAAAEAHERMRAWPGHRTSANRLFAETLTRLSRASGERAAVVEYDRLLRELPGTSALADELLAEYWERTALEHETAGERDEALLARLGALVAPTDLRRSAAAGLISDDYPQLIGALRLEQAIDIATLSADAERLTVVGGANVRTWSLVADEPSAMANFEARALALSPHIERLTVDGSGRAGAFALTVRLNHDRVSDLDLSLAAPSGRSVRLDLTEDQLAPDGVVTFRASRGEALAALSDDDSAGTWTLTVADTLPAISGTLDGWSLEFGRARVVEAELPGSIPLADPVPSMDASLTLSKNGRYLVAAPTAPQSAAQVWDLARAQPVSSLPLTPDDRILGFVIDERVVLVAKPVGLSAYALATGEPSWAPRPDGVIRQSALSLNGQFLATATSGEAEQIEVFDLIDQRRVGIVRTGSPHDSLAVSDDGSLVAVADPDQTVRLWALDRREPVGELPMARPVSALQFDLGRRHLAVTAGDLLIWRLSRGGEPRARLIERSSQRLVVDRGSGGVLSGGNRGYRVLDESLAPVEHPLLRHDGAGGPVLAVLRQRAGVAMSYATDAGTVKLWRVPLEQSLSRNAERPPNVATLSPDLAWLAFGGRDGELVLVEADAGPDDLDGLTDRVRFVGHAADINTIVFSPDSRLLATAADDSTVRLWTVADGEPLNDILRVAGGAAPAMAFSPDGAVFALAAGTSLELFDTETLSLLHRWQGGAPLNAVAFSDGDALLAGLADGYVARLRWQGGLLNVERRRVGDSPVVALAGTGDVVYAALDDGRIARLRGFQAGPPSMLAQLHARCSGLWLLDGEVQCIADGWLYQLGFDGGVSATLLPAWRLYPGLWSSGGGAPWVLAEADLPLPLALDAREMPESAEPLKAAELLRLWRQRLGFQGPGTGASSSAIDPRREVL